MHDTQGLPDAGHPPRTLGGRLRVGQREVEILGIQRATHGDQVPGGPVGVVLAQGAQLGPQDLVELTSLDVLGDLRLRHPPGTFLPVPGGVPMPPTAVLTTRPAALLPARPTVVVPTAGTAVTLLVHPRSFCS